MITEYRFSEKHAIVFSRYIRYNYKTIVETYQRFQPDIDDDDDEYCMFNHENAVCKLVPEYDEETDEMTDINAQIYFLKKQQRNSKHYFSFYVKVWKKCDQCPKVTFERIEEEFKTRIGKLTRICACESPIRNDEMDKCENCYIYSVVRDEPCSICLDNDYSWVKLNCNCKGGRVLHLHCFHKLQREYDDGWKTKCPYCRKKIGYWGNDDVIYNPDFLLDS